MKKMLQDEQGDPIYWVGDGRLTKVSMRMRHLSWDFKDEELARGKGVKKAFQTEGTAYVRVQNIWITGK